MGHGRASATAKNGARRGNIERISKSTRNALLSWGSQNFSNIINAQMGSGSSEDKALADELERYVSNSSYPADIWRGLSLSEKDVKSLIEGGDLSMHNDRGTLSSRSKSSGASFEFATRNAYESGGVPVMMVMIGGTKKGKDISDFVKMTDPDRSFEQEVLVSGKSKLKVEAITPTKLAGIVDGYIIEVKEK